MPIFSFLETLYLRNARSRRIAALVICAYPAFVFLRWLTSLPKQRLIDLFVRYVAARLLAEHGDIYSLSQLKAMADQVGGVPYGSAFSSLLLGYTHPPSDTFFDLRYVPFAYPGAKWIYLGESAFLYLACIILIWQTLRAIAPHPLHWVFPALLFVLFGPSGSSLGLGQSDITIFFLAVVAFWGFSRGRDLITGIAIGLAILTKLTPALLLLYWLWKREWRVVIYATATVIVVLVLSAPVVGIDRWIEFTTQVLPAISTGTAYAQNQSLPAFINRLMLDPRFAAGLQSAPNVPAVRAVTYAADLILIGLAAAFTRGRLSSRLSLRFALEYSLWLTVLLITSPISWDHYFTWLLLPVTVLLAALLNSKLSAMRAACLGLAWITAMWLVNTSTVAFFNYPEAWQRSPLLYGSLIIFSLLVERIESPCDDRPVQPGVLPCLNAAPP